MRKDGALEIATLISDASSRLILVTNRITTPARKILETQSFKAEIFQVSDLLVSNTLFSITKHQSLSDEVKESYLKKHCTGEKQELAAAVVFMHSPFFLDEYVEGSSNSTLFVPILTCSESVSSSTKIRLNMKLIANFCKELTCYPDHYIIENLGNQISFWILIPIKHQLEEFTSRLPFYPFQTMTIKVLFNSDFLHQSRRSRGRGGGGGGGGRGRGKGGGGRRGAGGRGRGS